MHILYILAEVQYSHSSADTPYQVILSRKSYLPSYSGFVQRLRSKPWTYKLKIAKLKFKIK